jgi:serine protease inhibitor
MKKLIYVMFLTALLAATCEKETVKPQYRELEITKTTGDIINGDNAFGFRMFNEIVSSGETDNNILISPVSISLALAMVYNGAEGDTKTEMENALMKDGFSREEINNSYKELIPALLSLDPKVKVQIANSIWYRFGFNVEQNFLDVNKDYYDAEVSPLDFSSPAAPGEINGWVSDKTNGKITSIVDQIPPDAVMYLINAIYFKGIWTNEFDPDNTGNRSFNAPEGDISVPFMNLEIPVNYASNDTFSMIELPYGQGNYSMVIMLPAEGKSDADIISSLSAANWDKWIADMTLLKTNISLPKFVFRYENQLNDELSALGMPTAFTDSADFSGINPVEQLLISRVMHKSYIEVNEEGTEAAAVTSVEVGVTSIGNELWFIADHPFIFAIRERSTGTIMFLGRLSDPS